MNKRYLANMSLCMGNTAAYVVPYTVSLIIGALITHFKVNEASAGMLMTVELLLMGIVALLSAPLLSRLPRRAFALWSASLLLVGNILAAYTDSYTMLYVARIIAGCGAGMLLAVVNAVIASADNPPRLYGLANMTACAVTAVVVNIMSHTMASYAHAGYFGVLIVLMCVVIALLFYFPAHLKDIPKSHSGMVNPLVGCVLLAGIFIIGASMMTYYSFVERFAVRLDLSLESIGYLFTGLMVASVIGSGMVAIFGKRFGILKPLLLATVLHMIVVVLAVRTSHTVLFAIAVFAQGLLYMFILPLQLAMAAELDAEGRWAAAASGTLLFSTGFGPFMGGWFITNLGYASIGWINIVATPIGLIAFIWAARRMRKTSF